MAERDDPPYTVSVFRYDPERGGEGHYDTFALDIPDPSHTTVLDVLIRLQKTEDPSLAFRFACRVNMCGSCGMVINGREGLACKTNVAAIARNREITLRPMNHFPVVKDLVVDMAPFFERYEAAMPHFEPRSGADPEPAVVRPDSRERTDIGVATECIACGCCVSSCTAVHHHADYLGPAALNRAFTLLCDSRDGLRRDRLSKVAASCSHCRTEFNCTEVCPKEISPTRAIKLIQRMALNEPVGKGDTGPPAALSVATIDDGPSGAAGLPRRGFLGALAWGLGGTVAAGTGALLVTGAAAPTFREARKQWVRVGLLEDIPENEVSTLIVSYERRSGFYSGPVAKNVIVHRMAGPDPVTILDTSCTHLGCLVQYDPRQGQILCACHGGKFDVQGQVMAGPPPRPLGRYAYRIEAGVLFAEMV